MDQSSRTTAALYLQPHTPTSARALRIANVNVNVYYSPQSQINGSPWLKSRSSTRKRKIAEMKASDRCVLTNPRRSTSMQNIQTTFCMQMGKCSIERWRRMLHPAVRYQVRYSIADQAAAASFRKRVLAQRNKLGWLLRLSPAYQRPPSPSKDCINWIYWAQKY